MTEVEIMGSLIERALKHLDKASNEIRRNVYVESEILQAKLLLKEAIGK